MKIVNEHAHWWKGVEKEWVAQDKSGNWWIFKDENAAPKENHNHSKKSLRSSKDERLFIFLAFALGISLALNVGLFFFN